MKARNPNTGNFEKLYVKALDSMPIGTEVDFNGQASDIPVGWEQVSGKNYTAFELYNNSTGVGTGTINLSDSITNYDYIEIFYKSNDANSQSSKKVRSQSSIFTDLEFWYIYGPTNIYIKATNININAATITFIYSSEIHLYPNQFVALSETNNIFITKVVGLKEE